MKKKKLTLGIAGALVAVSGLAACNEVTYNEGVILSYKDSSGTSVNFTAKELFDDYLPSNSSASTVFKNVREVLIRNYYNQPDQKSALDKATREAKLKVNGVRESAQKNADTNGTTYQVEWEKLLKSEGVENADELFDKKLLAEESDLFTKSYYTQSAYNAIRDGTRWTSNENGNTNLSTDELVKKYGPVTKGYLAEKAPYHVSHILVKLTSASNNEHTQDTISEKEAQKLPDGPEKDNKRKGACFLRRILESNSPRSMSMTAGKSMPYNFAQGFVELTNGHLLKGARCFMKKIDVPKLPKEEN